MINRETHRELCEKYKELEEEIKELKKRNKKLEAELSCLLYTSPSPRDGLLSRMPSSA